jgi:hypothetical protein
MAHGDAREGKWRGNWQMEWVASTLHTTSEHSVSSITTADALSSAASSRLNWHPCRFKWTRPFRRKTESCFCACAIAFQVQYTSQWHFLDTSMGNDVIPRLEGNPKCFRKPQAPYSIFCLFSTAHVRDRVVALHEISSLTLSPQWRIFDQPLNGIWQSVYCEDLHHQEANAFIHIHTDPSERFHTCEE